MAFWALNKVLKFQYLLRFHCYPLTLESPKTLKNKS